MEQQLTTFEKLETLTGFKKEEIGIISNTVAKGTTPTELGYFLTIARNTGLNPFMKQIWCYKDNKGNLIILAGRDGFLTIAQRDKRWNGMVSGEVYENDIFEVDVFAGTFIHKPNYKDRGQLIGAYCFVKPKGVDFATYEWATLKQYDKGQFIWNSHKDEMIKKVAEIHALKKAFGIDGIYGDVEIVPTIALDPRPEPNIDDIKLLLNNAKNLEELKQIEKENPIISINAELFGILARQKKELK
jgi:phage recombination protein Bet